MTTAIFEPSKQRTFDLLEINKGYRLLDVGCGTGEDVRAMASLVGSTGSVIGIDSSEAMVAEARKRTNTEGLPIEYQQCDAHQLYFADDTFDGSRAYHVLMHSEQPQRALEEIVRVTKPGGRVVLCEPDLETWIIDSPYRSVTRKILNFRCDGFRNGWIGRQLPALFQGCGLVETAIEPVTITWTDYAWTNQRFGFEAIAERAQEAGVVSSAEVKKWIASLEEAGRSGSFFAAFTMFIVSGRRH